MPAHYKSTIRLLVIFYKSTLLLSTSFAAMMAIFTLLSPALFIPMFAVAFMTGGTILSLLYKELSRKHEYYFYYNLAITKTTLFLTCALTNILLGMLLIVINCYA